MEGIDRNTPGEVIIIINVHENRDSSFHEPFFHLVYPVSVVACAPTMIPRSPLEAPGRIPPHG